MSTPRIHPLSPPYCETVQDAFNKIMPPGIDPLIIFRTFAHNPPVLRKQMALGAALLSGERVDHLDREIVLLRTCARLGSEYEWGVHVTAFARPLGLSEAVIRATVLGGADDPAWSKRQRLLIRFADELIDTASVSDELWIALSETWTDVQLLELLTVCGMYHGIAFVTNATRMEREADAERFPVPATAV